MLTDIFARRYRDYPIWSAYTTNESGLLIQCLGVAKDVLPYFSRDGKVIDDHKNRWKSIHDRLARELGLSELWPKYWHHTTKNWQGVDVPSTITNEWITMCELFVKAPYQSHVHGSPDAYMKSRLSLIELAVRDKNNEINIANRTLDQRVNDAAARLKQLSAFSSLPALGDPTSSIKSTNALLNATFGASVRELNVRFQQAGVPLSYHNGYIQVATDSQIENQISKPFWAAIADPKWQNVALDMSEALDRRDRSAGDAAWYACKGLESAIKIISDHKGWTRGTERGAHNYIDNLVAERDGARFVEVFEVEVLKPYFSHVRNRFGHGPGNDPMPHFTPAQTDWAIEFAMTWVRTLVRRL